MTHPAAAPRQDLRTRAIALVNAPLFSQTVIALILLNAFTLGLETNDRLLAAHAPAFQVIDRAILWLFVGEMALKLYAFRLSFFRSGWNLFDFAVIGIGLIPTTGPVAVFRVFRVLRVLRLISMVPQMRRVVNALLDAIPGMASIVAVLGIIFYVASILATKAFGTHPDPAMQEMFGSFGASMYSLFQIMTLEGWADKFVDPVLAHFPWALAFFIPFIVVSSFAVLNLFIGVIVDSMETIRNEAQKPDMEDILTEIRLLREEVASLKRRDAA